MSITFNQTYISAIWYVYGARFYDPQIARFHSVDPLAEKWPEYSPYNFTINNPVNLVDLDGKDIYILYYTTDNSTGDNMFKAAAETRKKDIENGGNFNFDKDKVITIGVQDISDIQGMTNWAVETYSEQFGKTAEVGVWSHSGLDGPVGTQFAANDALYEGSKQMSLDGWGKINFNWKESDASISFYGCNSAYESGSRNFANNISGLGNFMGVEVGGQPTSSYPSFFTNIRATSIARNYNMPGAWTIGGGGNTYLVGGNPGEGAKSTARMPTGQFPRTNQMNYYRNAKKVRSDYQSGKQNK